MNFNIAKVAEFNKHGGPVYALVQGSEPHLIFSGSSDTFIAAWNLKSFKQEKLAIHLEVPVYSLCYIHQKNWLLAGDGKGGIHIIDLVLKKEIRYFQFHSKPVFDLKYSPTHDYFIAASGDGSCSVWSVSKLSLIHTAFLCDSKLRCVEFDRKENFFLVGCGDGTLRKINTGTFVEERILIGHTKGFSVYAAKFSAGGSCLITGARDAHLLVWKLKKDFSIVQNIPAHNYSIYSIEFSPDNNYFATSSRDKSIKIWNAETIEVMGKIDFIKQGGHRMSVNKLLWTGYKNYLVSGGDDRKIMVWEINNKS